MRYFLFLLICLSTLPVWADEAIPPSPKMIQDCINAFSEQKIFLIIPGIILLTFSLLLLFLSKKKKHNLVYSITLCFFSILLFCSSFLHIPQIQACLGYEDCEIEVVKNSHRIPSWCEEMMDKYINRCREFYFGDPFCLEEDYDCISYIEEADKKCDAKTEQHWQYRIFKNFYK